MTGNFLKHTAEKAKQMQTMRPCILSSSSFKEEKIANAQWGQVRKIDIQPQNIDIWPHNIDILLQNIDI